MTDNDLMERWKAHFAVRPWERFTIKLALARKVLVVAHTRIEGAWCAYVDAVPGQNHDLEIEEVRRHGNKLSEGVARVLFPLFDGVPYAP